MKVNFDNMRIRLADSFDAVVAAHNAGRPIQDAELNRVGDYIGAILSLYDDEQEDFSDLGDRTLVEARSGRNKDINITEWSKWVFGK